MLALFWGPPPGTKPGDELYNRAKDDATDGAAFMAWLITAHLPKDEPFVPPHPDDPDYDPDEQAADPMADASAAAAHLRGQRATPEDDMPMPGPAITILPPGVRG